MQVKRSETNNKAKTFDLVVVFRLNVDVMILGYQQWFMGSNNLLLNMHIFLAFSTAKKGKERKGRAFI